MYPIYRGMYETASCLTALRGPNEVARSQNTVGQRHWQDNRLSRDSLRFGSRSNLAFYGISGGAGFGSIVLAVEPRFKTGILQGGGLHSSEHGALPERSADRSTSYRG